MKVTSGALVIAEANDGDLVAIEGNLYFPPGSVPPGTLEIFQQANRLSGGYSCEIISVSLGPVWSDSGLQVNAGHGVRDCAPCGIDILVVAGGTGVDTARDDAALAGWIAAAAAGAPRVTSVCSAACSCSRRRA